MQVGVPKETFPGETRVALVPAELTRLKKNGVEVLIEAGAGASAGFSDAAYEEKGARVLADRSALFQQADAIAMVRAGAANRDKWPEDEERLREGQVLFAMLDPLSDRALIERLAERGVSAFALELVPRITRAQSMDVLSSMATVAGYRAALLAAMHLPKFFPMFMTAAGTVPPARVLVIGAGVAGLQAIATARRLGAVLEAYDVRPAAKQEVESLGARFVELELEGEADEQGYAREQSEAFLARQRQLLSDTIAESHVVITTASVPGKPAPKIVTADMVERMRPGAVIVDIAAERGGNCDLTRPGETVRTENGVTILGPVNLPATLPVDASRMFARNLANLLLHVVKDGALELDWQDEITRGALVCHGGRVTSERLGGSPPENGGEKQGESDVAPTVAAQPSAAVGEKNAPEAKREGGTT